MPEFKIIQGDALAVLRTLEAESVHTCVTSPPYWGLRDYGVDGQLGLEKTPEEFVANMVEVFREVRRVLRVDGTLWLNLGDSYTSGGRDYRDAGKSEYNGGNEGAYRGLQEKGKRADTPPGLKPKDLVGIPWRVAFALQERGWYLRSDIIWCLSGGTWIYARTQKGDMPMMLRDAARLDPSTVKLWNGEKWTQVLGWSRSARQSDELEIVLRSGERISCTPTHQFPTDRGLLAASELVVGDTLKRARLPEPDAPLAPLHITSNTAWFAGLYIAEGSMSGDGIQIAGHAKEEARWNRVQQIAAEYGGSATRTISGNEMDIRVYGKLLVAVLRYLVSGRTAKDKGIASVCWRFSDDFLREMLNGYLSGDGSWDGKNNRWRLGFTRNYNLERDLRTLCARLGAHLVLNIASVKYKGSKRPTFRGEIRFVRSNHHNCRCPEDVVEIRKSRCREVYDVGVADEPHVFSLASGILTHNSKPNPMPESVTDRPTKAHEYVFLLAKSEKYYFDHEAVQEKSTGTAHDRARKQRSTEGQKTLPTGERNGIRPPGVNPKCAEPGSGIKQNASFSEAVKWTVEVRNIRSVWTIPTEAYPEAHFATFPEALVRPCILAGCPKGGTVLDPFAGSGTTMSVAKELGCSAIGIELNPAYIPLIEKRLAQDVLPLEAL